MALGTQGALRMVRANLFCMEVAPHRVKTPATTAVPKHAGMLACWHAGMLEKCLG